MTVYTARLSKSEEECFRDCEALGGYYLPHFWRRVYTSDLPPGAAQANVAFDVALAKDGAQHGT